MSQSTDKLWYLGALIPACIAFGPLFLSNQWGPWLLIVGLVGIYIYITQLHKRINRLEEQLGKANHEH